MILWLCSGLWLGCSGVLFNKWKARLNILNYYFIIWDFYNFPSILLYLYYIKMCIMVFSYKTDGWPTVLVHVFIFFTHQGEKGESGICTINGTTSIKVAKFNREAKALRWFPPINLISSIVSSPMYLFISLFCSERPYKIES